MSRQWGSDSCKMWGGNGDSCKLWDDNKVTVHVKHGVIIRVAIHVKQNNGLIRFKFYL